ncbi:hypothetical protein N658DRAFT_569172 [Parathielavia hyrcaniae]|uniref:Uncharacterized protein n=1 Tax=Parathielavia hyrcaniae TaxID=113614 RepID=A0AAN6SXN6_9PEZI|nr:hypothetical protein N658DRAFT_569172 [Parathielavia hyrcaniae]
MSPGPVVHWHHEYKGVLSHRRHQAILTAYSWDAETGRERSVPATKFVRLPPHIRHRIYLYTGVVRFDGHACTYCLDGLKESRRERSRCAPPPSRNFTGLLLSCRTLYTETVALLYSANRFVIFYSPAHNGSLGLKPLRALSPAALASLTSLKIVLNGSSCHQPTDSHNYPPGCCCCVASERKWVDAPYCDSKYHPTVHRRPLLDLTVDPDLASAKLATEPMFREWYETATYLSSCISVGRLELSLHRGYYQTCRPPCTNPQGGCPPDIHDGCRRIHCTSYVDPPDPFERHPAFFCRRRPSAFTSTCRCWAPSTDLFLICRVLCRDAQFVFFSRNRFIVHDFRALMPWDLPNVHTTRYYPYERLFASEFLRDIIPVHCLADLRFLELVFPPYVPHGWPNSERAAISDWCDTVDWIRDKINAPALTLSLAMVDFHRHDVPNLRRDLTRDHGNQIIKGYSSILRCLRPLARDSDDGLAGIYIQPAYHFRWAPDAIRRMQRDHYWLAKRSRISRSMPRGSGAEEEQLATLV